MSSWKSAHSLSQFRSQLSMKHCRGISMSIWPRTDTGRRGFKPSAQKTKTCKKGLLSSQELTGLVFHNQGAYGLFHPHINFPQYVKFHKPSMLQSKRYISIITKLLVLQTNPEGNLSMDSPKSLQVAGEVCRLAKPWKTKSETQFYKYLVPYSDRHLVTSNLYFIRIQCENLPNFQSDSSSLSGGLCCDCTYSLGNHCTSSDTELILCTTASLIKMETKMVPAAHQPLN